MIGGDFASLILTSYHCLYLIQEWNWQTNASGILIDERNKFELDTTYVCKEEIFDNLGLVKIQTSFGQKIECEILALNASFIAKYNLWDQSFLDKNWTFSQNLTSEAMNRLDSGK